MIINLTEKEIKTIDYCLQSKLIDVKGLAAIGACDRAVVEQMEGLIRKLETEAKDDCGYGIVEKSNSSNIDYDKILWDILKKHRGHKVSIVSYGNYDNPENISLECEDCGEVILDAELYTICAREDI